VGSLSFFLGRGLVAALRSASVLTVFLFLWFAVETPLFLAASLLSLSPVTLDPNLPLGLSDAPGFSPGDGQGTPYLFPARFFLLQLVFADAVPFQN